MDIGCLDFSRADLRRGDHAILNLGSTDGRFTDFCAGDGSIVDLG